MAGSCRWSSGGLKCPGSEQDKCTSGGSGHSCWCRVAFLILQFLSRKKNALNKINHRNFIICTFTKAWLIKHMLYELFPCMWKGFILWYFFFIKKFRKRLLLPCLIPSNACPFVNECSKGADSDSATIKDMHKMLQSIIWEASIFWKWNGKATLHLGQLFQTANCTYLTFKSVRYRFDLIAGYSWSIEKFKFTVWWPKVSRLNKLRPWLAANKEWI